MHMKIVKRDGRIVEYNSEKIRIAIEKANKEVNEAEKVSSSEIEDIIEYIESLDKKRMLVEDIQDIIEEKLMEKGHFSLAKKYIIYRYTRSIIRQSNTTDASILSLLKNNNYSEGSYLVANKQRDVMAGEASKDLAYRLLLPKNVVTADKDNKIKFCNVEYFTEPIIESTKLNIGDMLKNGTVINGVKIDQPKNFQSACNVLIEIIASAAFSQTGAIYVEFKELFEYYTMTYEKKYSLYQSLLKSSFTIDQIRALAQTHASIELKSGIQTILYQINTITLANGSVPEIYFLLDPSEIESEFEENLITEFIRQKIAGIKTAEGKMVTLEYPGIIYALTPPSDNMGRYEYITKEILNSELDVIVLSNSRYKKFQKEISRFNQGTVILNMGSIALEAKKGEEDFCTILERNLEYCYEAMLCRNHNLHGIYSDKSPIHWRYGGIARLGEMERIDQFLKKDKSYTTLSVIGFEAAMKILQDEPSKKQIRKMIEDKVYAWNKESSFDIFLSNYYDLKTIQKMMSLDATELKQFGIVTYYDSLEFMKEDYFKDGLMYYRTTESLEPIYRDIIDGIYIIKKDHRY